MDTRKTSSTNVANHPKRPNVQKTNRLFSMITDAPSEIIEIDWLKLGAQKVDIDDTIYEIEEDEDGDIWLKIDGEDIEAVEKKEPMNRIMERLLDQVLGGRTVKVELLSFLDHQSIAYSTQTDIKLQVKHLKLPRIQHDTPCNTIGPLLDARYLPLKSVEVQNEEYLNDVLIGNAKKVIVSNVSTATIARFDWQRVHRKCRGTMLIEEIVDVWQSCQPANGKRYSCDVTRIEAVEMMFWNLSGDHPQYNVRYSVGNADLGERSIPLSAKFKLNQTTKVKVTVRKPSKRQHQRYYQVHIETI